MYRRIGLTVVVLLASLVLAACGNNNPEPSEPPVIPATVTGLPAEPEVPPPDLAPPTEEGAAPGDGYPAPADAEGTPGAYPAPEATPAGPAYLDPEGTAAPQS